MYYFFDFHGGYLGFVTADGEFFDPNGAKWARLRGSRVVDGSGSEKGYVDAQGCFFDRDGAPKGYLRGWPAVSLNASRLEKSQASH